MGSHPGPLPGWDLPDLGRVPCPDHQETRDLVTAATLAFEDKDFEEQQKVGKDWREAHDGA